MEISVEKWKEIAKTLYLKGDRESQLLLGPPGVGKSEQVRQLAKELAEELNLEFEEYREDRIFHYLREKKFLFVDIRLTEVEPSDLIGLPRDRDGFVQYKPLGWALALSKNPGILFLDEITNVQRLDVQSTMYKLLLDRRVGYIPLHNDVLVIAAGNRPEESSIATALPGPAINRVKLFTIKAPSLDEWIEYMYRNEESWDVRIAAFLKRFSRYFLVVDPEETLEQFPTPRKWTKLALISKDIPEDMLEVVAAAEVGQEAAVHLNAFLNLEVPDIEEILSNFEVFDSLDLERKYFVLSQIASKVYLESKKSKDLSKFFDFTVNLFNADKELLTLFVFLIPRKCREEFMMEIDEKHPEIVDYLYEQFKKVVG